MCSFGEAVVNDTRWVFFLLTLAAFPRRMMVAPRLMQKTYNMDGERFRLVSLFLMIFHL